MLGREYTIAKLPGNTGRLSRRGSPPPCRRGCAWVRSSIFRAWRNCRGSRLSTWTSRSPGGRCLAPFGVGPSKRGSAGLGSRRKSSILSAMRPESVRFGPASSLPACCLESSPGSTRSIRIQTDCAAYWRPVGRALASSNYSRAQGVIEIIDIVPKQDALNGFIVCRLFGEATTALCECSAVFQRLKIFLLFFRRGNTRHFFNYLGED